MRSPGPSVGTLVLLLALAACDQGSSVADGRPPEAAFRNTIGMEFATIPAGAFALGSPRGESDRLENEGPQRTVRITRPFLLGRHEVTTGQWRAFAEASGYKSDAERDADGGFGIDFATGRVRRDRTITWRAPGFPGFVPGDRHPVVLISWQDAEEFCRWLSATEGRRYRLPTEAEWEYAARAGSTTAWETGSSADSLRGRANVADAALTRAMPAARGAESWDDGFPFLAPVGGFPPNAWGLHDMHGNVWEWCADWYAADAYSAERNDDPAGPERGRFRSIRGGGWFNGAIQNRSAQRVYFDPTFRYCLLSGFRLVLESELPAGQAPKGAPAGIPDVPVAPPPKTR